MIYLSDWLFDSDVGEIDTELADEAKENCEEGIKLFYDNWNSDFIEFSSLLEQPEYDVEKAQNYLTNLMRGFVGLVCEIKLFTMNNENIFKLDDKIADNISESYYQTMRFFHYDGLFMLNVIKGNKKHPLFFHYLLMCRVLSGFEEKVIAPFNIKNQ